MNLAQHIPVRYRQIIYSVIATAVALEGVFDLVNETWEGKILKVVTILGFGVALGNTASPKPKEDPLTEEDESVSL